MNVSLTKELAAFVEGKVKSGTFASASEVVRDALRESLRKDQENEYLRKEIQKGIDSAKKDGFIVLKTPEDFRSLAEDIKRKGRERIAREQKGTT